MAKIFSQIWVVSCICQPIANVIIGLGLNKTGYVEQNLSSLPSEGNEVVTKVIKNVSH